MTTLSGPTISFKAIRTLVPPMRAFILLPSPSVTLSNRGSIGLPRAPVVMAKLSVLFLNRLDAELIPKSNGFLLLADIF